MAQADIRKLEKDPVKRLGRKEEAEARCRTRRMTLGLVKEMVERSVDRSMRLNYMEIDDCESSDVDTLAGLMGLLTVFLGHDEDGYNEAGSYDDVQDDKAHSVLIMTDLVKDNQDRHIGNSPQEDDMPQFTREQVLTTQLIGVVN